MLLNVTDIYQSLWDDIADDWQLDYADLNDVPYEIDTDNRTLTIHNFGLKNNYFMTSPYFKPQVMLNIAEGLRMARHIDMLDGILHHYHPETLVLIGRICVADALTHKIHFSWELNRTAQDTSLWKHILCSDLLDMATAYTTMLEKMLSTGTDEKPAIQKSMAAAFNQYFSDENRINTCDHDTLNMVDDMITESVIFENKTLKKNIVIGLTQQGGSSQSYLESYLIEDILKNPFYGYVEDTINQSHLIQCMTDMNKFHVAGLVFQDSDLAQRFAVCE